VPSNCKPNLLCIFPHANFVASSYLTDLRSSILLRHDPLPTTVTCEIITVIISTFVRRSVRARARARLALSSSAPLALTVFVADLEALSFDDLEWERLSIDAFVTRVLFRLLVERVSVGVGVGVRRALEHRREHFREEGFATGKATANDSDRGFDANDDEENSAVPCERSVSE
jgi:hypothetical protein